MTSPEQEDFRRNLHGEWVLKPGVLSKKAQKLNPRLVKHESDVEDLASQFPKMPNPKYRIKEKDFAMQSSVKGATCRNVVMPVVDDRASTSKGIKSAILDMKCEVCRLRIYVCVCVCVCVSLDACICACIL